MRITAATIVSLLLSVGRCAAAPLGAGMHMPVFTLADQHDVEGSITPATRCVLFNRDMASAKVLQEALADNPTVLLDTAGAVIVSDISGMPRIITALFAVPAMRKRPYRMLLDREGKVTADFPFEKGKVTVVYVKDLTVEKVEFVESPEALRAALTPAAAPPTQADASATPQ